MNNYIMKGFNKDKLTNKDIHILYGTRKCGKTYEEIINNYIYASKLFNDKYKDNYRIDVFLDFEVLNIYLRDLKNNKYTNVKILNDKINNLFSEEILIAYEELIKEVYE